MTEREEQLTAALKRCQHLFDEALPKFNWGASFLDANAITLLNEVPQEVRKALEQNAEESQYLIAVRPNMQRGEALYLEVSASSYKGSWDYQVQQVLAFVSDTVRRAGYDPDGYGEIRKDMSTEGVHVFRILFHDKLSDGR